MNYDKVLILNFGSQSNLSIPRRVRELGVFCYVKNYKTTKEEILKINPKAIILSGEPVSDYSIVIDNFDFSILTLSIPILALGFCSFLLQQNSKHSSTKVILEDESPKVLNLDIDNNADNIMFFDNSEEIVVFDNPKYKVFSSPKYNILVKSDDILISKHRDKSVYCFNFFPIDDYKIESQFLLKNFLLSVAKIDANWTMKTFAEDAIYSIKEKVKDKKVLLALSGGVDSSVMAALLSKAVGKNLTCIFVDHGLMRKNEGDEIEKAFSNIDLNFVRVNAQYRFLEKLKGISDPETKRKIIGEEFIRIFEEEGKKIGTVDFLAQGTIYPDIIESGTEDSQLIKSHHNVGGLPDYVDFKEIIEPLNLLFKDEVRELGKVLGLEDRIVNRQPFPGPGLAIRVIGDITKEKLDILRDADRIFCDEIEKSGFNEISQQYFAVLTPLRSVGIRDNQRTYEYTLALRAVSTIDFMTVKITRLPFDFLEDVTKKIIDNVSGINRIVYDVTSKPPASIEWE